MTQQILLVEDDKAIRLGLRDFLRAQGHEVCEAGDGQLAQRLLRSRAFDLVVLDLMLPGPGGLELLRELRAAGHDTPVLILTARGDESDKVLGLELGADDYVTKPFGMREIGARVKALLRRSSGQVALLPQRFSLGSVQVDLGAHLVRSGSDAARLSPKEVGMLELLYAAKGEVVSRGRFLREVWGADPEVSARSVDTHVVNLRQKLEPEPRAPRHLLTVHGVGYRLCLDT